MNSLGAAGFLIAFVSIAVLAYPILDGEWRRRARTIEREFARLQSRHGLKGRFAFTFDEVFHHWNKYWYVPTDDSDWAAFGKFGGQLQLDAFARSRTMYWTDRRIGVLGILIAIAAAALGVASAI